MRSRNLLMCAGLAALCAACGGGGGSDAVFVPPPETGEFSAIAAKLDSFVSDGSVPGYAFALFDGDGVLYTRSAGNINALVPVFVASASKLPSAAAILSLVDSGSLDLDRPVADYISSDIVWPFDKRSITMRMLLSHTSALETQPACLENGSTTTLKQCAQEIANAPLSGTPGTAFAYGGGSYQVAGYVATRISGKSWQDFFNSRIAGPLNLTAFNYGGGDNPRIGGGAIATVGDEAKIMRMVLAGGTIDGRTVLSPAMVNQLLSNQIAGKSVAESPLSSVFYPGYTLGYFVSSPSLHRGSRGPEYSDPGLFGTVPWIDVGSHYGGVILINKDAVTGLNMWNRVRPLIISKLGVP